MIVEEYQAEVSQAGAVEDRCDRCFRRGQASSCSREVADLLDFVRARADAIDLVAMAYTLQAGREPMDERLGFWWAQTNSSPRRCQAYVAGDWAIEDAYQGQVKRNKEAPAVFATDADLQQAVDKWIAGRKVLETAGPMGEGLELDWSKLYGETRPQRISLPTYPFAKERYWVEIAESDELEESFAIPQPVEIQPVFSDVLPEITATLKMLLANELQMRESDIGENVQFVDLGLDSITGVTWVRKINEKYQASIEAIKLYSYPTLAQLSRYVKEEAEKHGTLPKQDAVANLP